MINMYGLRRPLTWKGCRILLSANIACIRGDIWSNTATDKLSSLMNFAIKHFTRITLSTWLDGPDLVTKLAIDRFDSCIRIFLWCYGETMCNMMSYCPLWRIKISQWQKPQVAYWAPFLQATMHGQIKVYFSLDFYYSSWKHQLLSTVSLMWPCCQRYLTKYKLLRDWSTIRQTATLNQSASM